MAFPANDINSVLVSPITVQPTAGPSPQDPLMTAQTLLGQQNVQAQQLRDTRQGVALLGQEWQSLLGGNSTGKPEIPSGTPILSLKPEQLAQIFGGDAAAMRELAGKEAITVGQGVALMESPGALGTIQDLLSKRSDLRLSDMLRPGGGGLLPVLNDPETRKLIVERGMNPRELAAMQQIIAAHVQDPTMGKAAYRAAVEMLGSRDNLKPQALGELFGKIMGAVGGDPQAAPVAVSMFRDAGQLLKSGMEPDQVQKLVMAAGKIGGGEGLSGANQVAMAFREAATFALERPGSGVDQILATADVIAARFPGKDNPDRMQAFRQSLGMLAQNPNMDARGIDAMLGQAAGQGLKGDKLLKAFETQGQALANGTANIRVLTDPNARPDAVGGLRFARDGQLLPNQPGQPGAQPGQGQRPGQPGAGQGQGQGQGVPGQPGAAQDAGAVPGNQPGVGQPVGVPNAPRPPAG